MIIGKKAIGKFKVNSIGIGTWSVGGGMTASSVNDEDDIEAIRYSLKKGQNHIDTAELYGGGHSEEVVGEAIKGHKRDDLFLATKVWRNNATAERVPAAAEESLKRLQVDYVDLLYIHACWEERKIESYIKGLNKAQDAGLTKALGVSNFNLRQLKKALSLSKHPIIALQNHYNVNHQHEVDNKMKDFCKKEGITIVAYSPLEGATTNRIVVEMAEKYQKTPEQIALNWLISQENVVTIPKSTDKDHIDENLKAADFEMEEKDHDKLSD
jgi:diketogulonate reductase-like aldo/keto reductase